MVSLEKHTFLDGCTVRFINNYLHFLCKDRAEKPDIMISGKMRVGESVMQCTVYHTCPTNPPTVSLNIPLQSHSLTHSSMSDGTSKTTLTTTLNIESDLQPVECSVRHTGGLTARATKNLKAECMWWVCKYKKTVALYADQVNFNIYYLYLRLHFTLDYPISWRISWGTGKQSNLHCLIHVPKTYTKSQMERW